MYQFRYLKRPKIKTIKNVIQLLDIRHINTFDINTKLPLQKSIPQQNTTSGHLSFFGRENNEIRAFLSREKCPCQFSLFMTSRAPDSNCLFRVVKAFLSHRTFHLILREYIYILFQKKKYRYTPILPRQKGIKCKIFIYIYINVISPFLVFDVFSAIHKCFIGLQLHRGPYGPELVTIPVRIQLYRKNEVCSLLLVL